MIIIYKEGNLLIQSSYMTRSAKYGFVTHPLPKPYFDTYRGSLIVPLSPDYLAHPTEYTASHPDYKHDIKPDTPLFNYNGLQLIEFTPNVIKLHFTNQDKEICDDDISHSPKYYVVTHPYHSLLKRSEFAYISNYNLRNELNLLMYGNASFDKLKEWVYSTAEHVAGFAVESSKENINKDVKEMLYKITIGKPESMEDTLLDFMKEQYKRIESGEKIESDYMAVLSSIDTVISEMVKTVSPKPIFLPI